MSQHRGGSDSQGSLPRSILDGAAGNDRSWDTTKRASQRHQPYKEGDPLC